MTKKEAPPKGRPSYNRRRMFSGNGIAKAMPFLRFADDSAKTRDGMLPQKERTAAREAAVGGRGEAELLAEKHALRKPCSPAVSRACAPSGPLGGARRAGNTLRHADQGSQFASWVFRTALRRHERVPSMSGTGRRIFSATGGLPPLAYSFPDNPTLLSSPTISPPLSVLPNGLGKVL